MITNRKHFHHLPRNHDVPLVEQINTDNGRFYQTPNGSLYPSVTTVTGLFGREGIKKWRKTVGEEQANKITSKATSRGTRIHKLIEDYIDNREIDQTKYTFQDMLNFNSLQPVLDNLDNIHMQEERLYSDYLQMAGTVDCVAEYSGKLAVVDFKTSTKLKDPSYLINYFCQATAYCIMYEERFSIEVPRFVIMITIDDQPEPQIIFGKRDNFIEPLMRVREQYRKETGK